MKRALGILFAITLSACASEVGNDGATVGGSCLVSHECSPESRCVTGVGWPGGYCANACDTSEDCLAGSVCVEAGSAGGVCVVSCTGAGECRTADGYECVSFPRRGGAVETVMGCGTL